MTNFAGQDLLGERTRQDVGAAESVPDGSTDGSTVLQTANLLPQTGVVEPRTFMPVSHFVLMGVVLISQRL